jgi:hypothetical protein
MEREMNTCEPIKAQLLTYLYDLLETDERLAVEAHLAGCPACRAALDRARSQKQILSVAAKAEFPSVQFAAPNETTTRLPEQNTSEPAQRRMRPVLRSAIAASILALVVAGLPAGWWLARDVELRKLAHTDRIWALQVERRKLITEHEGALSRAETDADLARRQIETITGQYEQKVANLGTANDDRQLQVAVTGPERIQPGTNNHFQIRTVNAVQRPVAVDLTARVRDEANTLLFEAKDVASAGDYRLTLPADLPVKPDSNLSLEVVARREGGQEAKVKEAYSLVAPVYLTHLYTDKPMYRPGDTIHFRSLTLERFSLKPVNEEFHLIYTIANPNGEEVFHLEGRPQLVSETKQPVLGPDQKPLRGIGAGEFKIDPAAKGGEYTLTVREQATRFPPQQRKFIINQYENPRLNKELDFTRKSYGPADEVVAACRVARAEGGIPVANQPVAATIFIDGKSYTADGTEGSKALTLKTDEKGHVSVRFKLPAKIDRGQGTLSVQFSDGASVETLVRPIPIALKKLDIEFFPEGGDFIADVPNRVYFQARTMLGKPAEVKGRIVDELGEVVVNKIETLNDDKEPGINQGMGLFTFTPEVGKSYRLKIDSPAGIEGKYELPKLVNEGVVLAIPNVLSKDREPIEATVYSADRDRNLLVGAYCRGRLMDHQMLSAKKGKATKVTLRPSGPAGGVYRVTVFEEKIGDANRRQFVPKAERLIYRSAGEKLILNVTPDHKQYTPGEKVRLSLNALAETEKETPAVLLVSVVDKSVITMADEKTARAMPTHFFLTTEVRKPEELEYTDILLGSHPKAAQALDLLLGTQGWRRFAEQNPGEFQQKFADDATRFLATIGMSGEKPVRSLELEANRLKDEYIAQRRELLVRWEDANAKWKAASDHTARLDQMDMELTRLQGTSLPPQRELAEHRELGVRMLKAGFAALAIVCSLVVLLGILSSIRSTAVRTAAYAIGLSSCVAIVIAIAVYIDAVQDQSDARRSAHVIPRSPVMHSESLPANAVEREELRSVAKSTQVQRAYDGGRGMRRSRSGEAATMVEAKSRKAPTGFDRTDAANVPPRPSPRTPPERPRELALLEEQWGAIAQRAGADAKAYYPEKPFFLPGKGANVPGPIVAKEAGTVAKPSKSGLATQQQAGELGGDKALVLKNNKDDLRLNKARDRFGEGRMLGEAKRKKDRAWTPQMRAGIDKQLEVDEMDPEQRGARRRGGKGEGGEGMAMGEAMAKPSKPVWAGRETPAPPLAVPELVIREYAHHHTTAGSAEERTDFVDTVCWQPAFVLTDGKGEVAFDLCDSVTSYQVTVFGHTLDGRIGAATSTIESRLPFTLEPKLPIEVTASDKIDVPISIANNTNDLRQVNIRMDGTNLRSDGKKEEQLAIGPDSRVRRIFRLQPSVVEGHAAVRLEGKSDPFTDSVTRTFSIVPEGFPYIGSKSDLLEGVAQHDIVLPETWLAGTLKCQVQVYPSTLADLQKGLASLLQEPHGCFEQTSSSNYPNVMILHYLKESEQANADVERRARELLGRGYNRLLAFECMAPGKGGREGYEWFGGTVPPHEALTAYGLIQFSDMAGVFDVDKTMVERTLNYLLSRRDGQGGFLRNPRSLDHIGRAPQDITNAYIVWALTESSKVGDVTKELAALSEQAKTSKDPYFLSLVALGLINRDKANIGTAILKKVAAAQKEDGHLEAANTSITGSGGRDLTIETTALAVLGWLKANRPVDFNQPIQKAIKWIGQQRGGYGGFGGSQSTVLALKALIAHTKATKQNSEAGTLRLVAGKEVTARLDFPAGASDTLTLPLPEPDKNLKPGKNRVRMEITGKNQFPYTLSWSYRTLKPASGENIPVRMSTKLDRDSAVEGETVHLTVKVENTQDKGQGMAIAIIGLPAGLTLPEDMKQLKDHARLRNGDQEPGLISAWETRGRELILYWRDLAPKQNIEVPVDLICRVPGEYRGPSSRSYLYYNSDLKHWVEPLQIHIQPAAGRVD